MKKIFAPLLLIGFSFTISSCNHSKRNIPLPEYINQPKTVALHWSAPQKIRFYDTTNLKVTTKNLEFNALPEEAYDSSVAQPFSKEPIVTHFNWDSLPYTTFNYNNLPAKPLHFKTYIVTPKIMKAGPLAFYDFKKQPFFQISNGNKIGLVLYALEDKAGFIWIASINGLYRYDGQNLVRYLKTSTRILGLKEDSKGQIWILFNSSNSSFKGMDVLNTQKNTLQQLSARDMGCTMLNSLLPDSNGKIWVATDSGLRIIDVNRNLIRSLTVKQGMSAESALSFLQDEEKNIWVTTINGLNIIDVEQGTITYLKKENGLPSDSTWQIKEDNGKRIWLNYPYFGLCVIDRQAGSITSLDNATLNLKPTGKGGGLIFNIADDGKGNMLVDYVSEKTMESNDVKIINLKNKTSRQIRNLQYGLVYSMFGDRYGQTWLCYLFGLFVLNKNGRHIYHAGNTDTTTALTEDARNNLWIGTTNGIKILNPATGKAKIFNEIPGIRADSLLGFNVIDGKIYVRPFRGTDIIDSAYTTITQFGNSIMASAPVFHNGDMWQLNWETHGIEVFKLKKKLHFHVDVSEEKQSQPGNKQSQRPQTLIQDKEGNISLCSGMCFLGVIDSGSAYIRYTDSALSPEVATEKPMCFDTSGNVWIGIDTILYRINKRRDSVTMFTPKNGLLNSAINSLTEYNDRIYAGTGSGVSIVTPPHASTGNTWRIQSLGRNDGFNNGHNQAEAITHDGTYLWEGNGGITFLPPQQLNKKIDSPKTYITGIDVYNEPQYFSAKPGGYGVTEDTMWDANTGKYYLKGQKFNTTSGHYERKMKWDSTTGAYNMPVNLTLAYDENNIKFHFVQSNAGSQDAVLYKYILGGNDTTWSDETSNTSSNNYFDLPNGSYTFKVSSLYNNKWSKPVEFSFSIARPWWETWWAFVIYFVLIGLIYAAFRSFNLNRQNKLLEVKVNQRTEQLNRSLEDLKSTQSQLIQSEKMASLGELTAGIAHEIQNPLNFVNNFSDVNKELLEELKDEADKGNMDEVKAIANDVIDNEEKINHHGKRADAIVKGMLQHSRASSGKKEPTDINTLCDEYLRLSYHGMRAKDKDFNANIKTDFDESIGKIKIVPQDIGRVLLNLFNNAFYVVNEKKKTADEKYQPLVSVQTKQLNKTIELAVTDNGNGIPQNIIDKIFQPFFTTKPTGQGTGLGLSLSYDIVKAHGGNLKVKTIENKGSEFIIQLPITA